MTTRITVDAHAGWPVEVTTVDLNTDGSLVDPSFQIPTQTVQPHTTREFYVTSHRELHIKEVVTAPVPEAAETPVAPT